MAADPLPFDISGIPELVRLADEVRRTRRPRLLRRGDRDVAVVMPLTPALDADSQSTPVPSTARSREEMTEQTAEEDAHQVARKVARRPGHRSATNRTSRAAADPVLAELRRRRQAGVDIVTATAGIVQYDGPPLSIEEERAAFEQGVADEAMESLGG